MSPQFHKTAFSKHYARTSQPAVATSASPITEAGPRHRSAQQDVSVVLSQLFQSTSSQSSQICFISDSSLHFLSLGQGLGTKSLQQVTSLVLSLFHQACLPLTSRVHYTVTSTETISTLAKSIDCEACTPSPCQNIRISNASRVLHNHLVPHLHLLPLRQGLELDTNQSNRL